MKQHHACFTASVLLFCVIIGSTFSANYLDYTASYILNKLDELPHDVVSAQEIALGIKDFWEERKKVLDFTLSETSLDCISLLFDELLISIEYSDQEEYQKSTTRLRRAVESINQLEKITPENIF